MVEQGNPLSSVSNTTETKPVLRAATACAAGLLACCAVFAQAPAPGSGAKKSTAQPATGAPRRAAGPAHPDLRTQPTLYVIGYAHLDTEWRWEYPQTIDEYLSKTLRSNFALADKYPHYLFNFTGANRFMMMKEYFPADFARLKQYVAAGRWFPAGSSMEESDVNSPSAESLFRQILYGNDFYRQEFGKASSEYMLPDCFGFPASLPTILHHAGILGFSTQKLNSVWQPAPKVGGPDSPEKTPEGIPFNVGLWEGTDRSTVIAALNPGSYTSTVFSDLSKSNSPPADLPRAADLYTWDWPARVDVNGKLTGIYTDYHYVGTGDIGGAPGEDSVKLMEAIESRGMATVSIPNAFRRRAGATGPSPAPGRPVRVGDGPLHVIWAPADQMFLDMQGDDLSRLPRYKGDLELINHSAGSLTSQAYQKRWNRKNETLAQAAEEASVAAMWLGGLAYPRERLNAAWRLVLGAQFHDLMAGTATPKSYNYAWNDDVLAMNQFSAVLMSATEAVAAALDTRGDGSADEIPIVVFNPLNIEREDVVEANVRFPAGAPAHVRVAGPRGAESDAQVELGEAGAVRVLFLAKVPPVGFGVYRLKPAAAAAVADSELEVSLAGLENARYRVRLNEAGDVSSIYDKLAGQELLREPMKLAIITDNPRQWPAWNMDFEDEQNSPRAYVSGPTKTRIAENGPVRAAIEITRETEGSRFIETVRLSAGGAGNRVEFAKAIDWHTQNGTLKAVVPLASSNNLATYNWDVGTVERPTEEPRQFEVATHQWIDLTDASGAFGATLLTDSKYGSDKPDDHTLRLTLIRTPGTRGGYEDQGSQDLGHHEIVFGLAGHQSDWRQGNTDWQAWRLNQPLLAFQTSAHAGALGREFALLNIDNNRVRVLALKKAEHGGELILRMVEISGKPQANVHIGFAAHIVSAREVDAQELHPRPVQAGALAGGKFTVSFEAYQPRTFALKIAAPKAPAAAPVWKSVDLPFDVSVASRVQHPGDGCFDCVLSSPTAPQGAALPAEMLRAEIAFGAIHFRLAPAGTGKPDAVAAAGQKITLPAVKFSRVYVLAASAQPQGYQGPNQPYSPHGDIHATFELDDRPVPLEIENWTGFIGQWDNRGWTAKEVPIQRPDGAAPPPGAPATRTVMEFNGQITPGYIKRADVAWFASHRHSPAGGDEAYDYSYLFAYAIDAPHGAKTLTLPDNERVRVLAVTVADGPVPVFPAAPLYDTLEHALAPEK